MKFETLCLHADLNKKKNTIATFMSKLTKRATYSLNKNNLIPNLTKR